MIFFLHGLYAIILLIAKYFVEAGRYDLFFAE